ncbi:hypothetical protein [Escherichia coli]|uniref:hypothetical protein n=3 Tax=Escherichia coli TaxID=562 RepID=UPI00202BB113|nr:hypothetical protein [Escherichia coli]
MKQKFIEWFTKNNNGCSPAMEDDRSFVYEMTQNMFEAYQAGVAEGEAKCAALAAENAGLNKFIEQSCYVYNGDGSDISDSYTPAHESPMMPEQKHPLLPVVVECMAIRDAFIRYLTSENLANKPDASEQQVCDHCAKWVDAMCETPATDAFLAEVRAQGVEMLTAYRKSEWMDSYIDDANEFAAQLRKGTAL